MLAPPPPLSTVDERSRAPTAFWVQRWERGRDPAPAAVRHRKATRAAQAASSPSRPKTWSDMAQFQSFFEAAFRPRERWPTPPVGVAGPVPCPPAASAQSRAAARSGHAHTAAAVGLLPPTTSTSTTRRFRRPLAAASAHVRPRRDGLRRQATGCAAQQACLHPRAPLLAPAAAVIPPGRILGSSSCTTCARRDVGGGGAAAGGCTMPRRRLQNPGHAAGLLVARHAPCLPLPIARYRCRWRAAAGGAPAHLRQLQLQPTPSPLVPLQPRNRKPRKSG